mmetsp:Transcript_32174/g.84989  ORF Transcript_32174/g.84989 Transcript_32174/m.84989 type:complete len:95 (+) Transcript_32174:110-394(+)
MSVLAELLDMANCRSASSCGNCGTFNPAAGVVKVDLAKLQEMAAAQRQPQARPEAAKPRAGPVPISIATPLPSRQSEGGADAYLTEHGAVGEGL